MGTEEGLQAEVEILRDRLKEYRDLLEVAYSLIADQTVGPIKTKFLLRLREHGIRDKDQRPIFDRSEL